MENKLDTIKIKVEPSTFKDSLLANVGKDVSLLIESEDLRLLTNGDGWGNYYSYANSPNGDIYSRIHKDVNPQIMLDYLTFINKGEKRTDTVVKEIRVNGEIIYHQPEKASKEIIFYYQQPEN